MNDQEETLNLAIQQQIAFQEADNAPELISLKSDIASAYHDAGGCYSANLTDFRYDAVNKSFHFWMHGEYVDETFEIPSIHCLTRSSTAEYFKAFWAQEKLKAKEEAELKKRELAHKALELQKQEYIRLHAIYG